MIGRLTAVLAFFGLRVLSALILLKLAASFLSVSDFADLAQFLAYSAFLNLVAVCGTQNGIIREVAAARDAVSVSRTHCAALSLWAASLPVFLMTVALAGGWISEVLVGNPGRTTLIVVLTIMALAAGPGQIWCSILTGRRHTVASLGAQGTGLIAGTAVAAWYILQGRIGAAAIGFACGPVVASGVAFTLARPLRIGLVSVGSAVAEARRLLRYSAALAAVSGMAAVALFALRAAYRDVFGSGALGYWLAANRISDLSTQLAGLFILQVYVPHLAGTAASTERERYMLRCGLFGTVLMLLPLVVFSLAPEPLVRIFLSDAFLPAIPVIRTYMLGDMLRIWASLAMFAAFALGKPGRYAAIELTALAIMALVTIMLISAGQLAAPQWGYLAGYGSVSLAAFVILLMRRHHARTASVIAETV